MRALSLLALVMASACIFDPAGTRDEASSEDTTSSTTSTTTVGSGGAGASGGSSSTTSTGGSTGATGGSGGVGGATSSSSSGGSGGSGGADPCGDGDIDPGEECDQGGAVSAFCLDCQLVCPAPISGITFSKSTGNTTPVCYAAKLGAGGLSKGLDFGGASTNLNERCDEYATTLGAAVEPATPDIASDVGVVGALIGANNGWIGAKRSGNSWAWESSDAWTYVDHVAPWGAPEPNDFGGMEDCVGIIGADTLNDNNCNADSVAVCEVRPPGE